MTKPYNIFISWSGRRSKVVAEKLRDWLPTVIQAAKPFMSDTDIDKGSRGLYEVSKALEGMKIGIVCLTPENLNEPWIAYEAGALSKSIDDKTRLWTYLLSGLQFQDVRPPLGMFQHTRSTQEETRKLVHSINLSLNDDPVSEPRLDAIFEKMWPDLEQILQTLPAPDRVAGPRRSPDEMITEILELTRNATNSRKQSEWIDKYVPTLQRFFPMLEQLLKNADSAGHQVLVQPQTRSLFGVKLKYDDEGKVIEGTKAEPYGLNGLIIFDGEAVVARFDENVEFWWKQSANPKVSINQLP